MKTPQKAEILSLLGLAGFLLFPRAAGAETIEQETQFQHAKYQEYFNNLNKLITKQINP